MGRLAVVAVLSLALASACTHSVRVREAVVAPSASPAVTLAVNVVMDSRLRTYEAHPSTYAGVIRHTFDVPVGPPLVSALERAARAAFRDAASATASTPERPTLTLGLDGEPVVNVQWEQGLFLVGQRTDCILAVQARLLTEAGDQVWQTVVTGHGHHETGRLANWPTADQSEPAVRQAIEALASDLVGRLTTAREINDYAGRETAPILRAVEGAGKKGPPTIAVPLPQERESRPRADAHAKTADRLRELEQMRIEGLITNDEYRQKRQSILNDL
jgi:hypothetical protein